MRNKKTIWALSILILLGMAALVCCRQTEPLTTENNSKQENSLDRLFPEEESKQESSAAATQEKTAAEYHFYPEDMSIYGDKTVIHLGVLNFLPGDNFRGIYEQEHQQIECFNEYLVKQNAPYVVQIVGCTNRSQLYDAQLLEQTERELGFTFDLVNFWGHFFSADDLAQYMEPMEEHLAAELLPLYETRPANYWSLLQENGHIYNLYDQTNDFYSLAIIYQKISYGEDHCITEGFLSKLAENQEITQSLGTIQEFLLQNTMKTWHFSAGTGTWFLQNGMQRIPFTEWSPDTYFASVAPLIGADFVSGSEEIISLLDSPTFQAITEQYRFIKKERYLSNGDGTFAIINRVGRSLEEYDILLPFEQPIYYNEPYEDGHRYMTVRKDSGHKEEVMDLIIKLTTNREAAEIFYMGNAAAEIKGNIFFLPYYRFINGRSLVSGQDAEQVNAMIEQALPTPVTGFVFDKKPVKDEILAVERYLEQSAALTELEKTENWDEWDKWYHQLKEELDELGFQKILQEANRQYQEWRTQ